MRGREHLRGRRTGFAGAALHVGDIGRDLLGAFGGLLHVAGDFLRRRALLFDRSGNGRGDLRQLFDGAADLLDRVHRVLGRGLDTRDLLTDLAGGLCGLLGQRLHFGRHDGKAATGFAGARRLDGGVERQQIGLARDGVDQFDDVADAARGFRQFADAVVGGAGLVDGLIGHPRRFLHLTADLVDRRGQLFGCRRHRLHIGGGFFGRRRHRRGDFLRPLGGLGQHAGGSLEFGRGRRHGLDDLADRAFEVVRHLDHVGLALPGCDLILLHLGLGFVAGLLLRDDLEFLDGACDATDLILAAKAGQHDGKVATGKLFHRSRQGAHRTRDGEEGKNPGSQQQHNRTNADGQRCPLGDRHFMRCLGVLLFHLVLGKVSDLCGKRFSCGGDRKRHFPGNADRFGVQLCDLRRGVGTGTRRAKADRLAAHDYDLLGPFDVVGCETLELFNARAIFAGVRQFRHVVGELVHRRQPLVQRAVGLLHICRRVGEADVANADLHATERCLCLDGVMHDRLLHDRALIGLPHAGVAVDLACDHRSDQQDAKRRRNRQLGPDPQILNDPCHCTFSSLRVHFRRDRKQPGVHGLSDQGTLRDSSIG